MPVILVILCVLYAMLHLGIVYQIIMGNRPSGSKLFWMVFTWIPVIGLVFYLVFGINYRTAEVFSRIHDLPVKRIKDEIPQEMAAKLFQKSSYEMLGDDYQPLAHLLEGAGEGNKVYSGNSFEIITGGGRKRELILQDLKNAKRFIHMEYFKFGNDSSGREVRDVLIQKAREGVQVRFLYNSMTMFRYPRSYFSQMREAGIELIPYTHIKHGFRSWIMHINHQNHRKIVVIDGEVAYTGGMNLNDNYFYKWRDTHLRLHGPVIAGLQASFTDHWLSMGGDFSSPLPYYFESPYNQSSSDPFHDQTVQIVTDAPENAVPATQMGYEWVLGNASDYVFIQTPYFTPPEPLLQAIKAAALRGVDVRLSIPRHIDAPMIGPASHGLFRECLEAGVRIYLRDGAFIHAKTLVADDNLTIIGASNLDNRSFSINCEVNTFIYGRDVALSYRETFLEDLQEAQEVKLDSWVKGRKWYHDLWSRFLLTLQYQF